MSNWTGNTVPNWYKDIGDKRIDERPQHSNDAGSLFQTDRGWEREIRYTDQNGNSRVKRYVVVADREAQTDTSVIYVTDMRVANAADFTTSPATAAAAASGSGTQWTITFNQAVALSDSFTWQAAENDGTVGTVEATYLSGNLTNQITVEYDTGTFATSTDVGLTGVCTTGLDGYDPLDGTTTSLTIAAGADVTTVSGGLVDSGVTFVDGATANVVVG